VKKVITGMVLSAIAVCGIAAVASPADAANVGGRVTAYAGPFASKQACNGVLPVVRRDHPRANCGWTNEFGPSGYYVLEFS